MPYDKKTMNSAAMELLVHGYLHFLGGENIYQQLEKTNFKFTFFFKTNHLVAAVRQGDYFVFNDSFVDEKQVRFKQLIQDAKDYNDFVDGDLSLLRDYKGFKITNYFTQENAFDCSFCATWFVIYAIGWHLQHPSEDIRQLPQPLINPFSYVKSNKNNKTQAPIASTYLSLLFYGYCLKLSVNFKSNNNFYSLPNKKLIFGSSVYLSTEPKIIADILTDLCDEHKLAKKEKMDFIVAVQPLLIGSKTLFDNDFILYRNIVLYLLLYHFQEIRKLIKQEKSALLSYENIIRSIQSDQKHPVAEKMIQYFGAQAGYVVYAKKFFVHANSSLDYKSSGGRSITLSQFKDVLEKDYTTSEVRFFCCCRKPRRGAIEELKEIEAKLARDARVTEDTILTAINKDSDHQRRRELFLKGEGNNGSRTDEVILSLREAIFLQR